MVLPQVLQEGRDGARQVARAARAARGPGHEAGALTETHKHNPRFLYDVWDMVWEGRGGLGRAGEAPGRCFDVRLRIYGFTDLTPSLPLRLTDLFTRICDLLRINFLPEGVTSHFFSTRASRPRGAS